MKRLLVVVFVIINALVLFPQDADTGSAVELLQENSTDSEAELLQEETEQTEAEDAKTVLNPAYVLERDIATSTQEELADWCLSLGLNNEGSREALASQLREYYKLDKSAIETIETDEDDVLIISIENAKTTEYFTVDSVHEEYVRLSGGVSLALKNGTILHRVAADQILYNRTRKLLTAKGNVVYVKEDGDKVETFSGEGITVNLDNWSVAFMKGVSDHALSGGETRYRFAGEVISRSGEDSTVLRNAEVTNPDDEESLWSIKASKLWLLPGSDWAVLNAVVKVGKIPVLWLPAFYYPANEIIFHPVLGFRSREGTYVQTTTYILGRPRASSSSETSSITTIMGSGEDMEKKREGVFLRSTGARIRDEKEVRLSVMADAYVNLGYYLGSELFIPSKDHLGELSFSGGIAFSRDIATDMGNYTPFVPDYNRTSKWHSSWISPDRWADPFRYRFLGTGSVNTEGKIVRHAELSWNIPLYSDPYIDNDFMRRSEDSTLFSNLKSATTPELPKYTTTHNNITYTLIFNDVTLPIDKLNFKPKNCPPEITYTLSAVTTLTSALSITGTGDITLPPGTFLPGGTVLPSGTVFPPETVLPDIPIPSDGIIPSGGITFQKWYTLQDVTSLLEGTKLPGGTVLPYYGTTSFTLPDRNTLSTLTNGIVNSNLFLNNSMVTFTQIFFKDSKVNDIRSHEVETEITGGKFISINGIENAEKIPDVTLYFNVDTILSSYSLQLNGRLSFVTTPFEPYVNELSITSAAMAFSFNTRETNPPPNGNLSYPPDSSFFYPDKFTLFSITGSIGGKPVVLGERKAGAGEDAVIEGWPALIPPWESSNAENTGQSENAEELVPPSISRTVNSKILGGHLFTIDYRLAPAAASEMRFNSDQWRRNEDIDWSDIEYQLFSIRADGNIGLTLSERNDIYTHSLRFYGTTSWQDYSYMDDTVYTGAKLDTAMRQMRNMRYLTSSASYGFTIFPFFQSEMWQTSNLNYTLKGLLGSGRYINDEWTMNAGKWDRNDIEIHSLQGNFNANIMDYMQSLSITADLPSKEATIAADATARVWISETNTNTRILRPFEDPYYEPVYFTETLRFADNISLRHYMVYDPEISDWTMMTTSLVFGGLSASFTATRSFGYDLVTKAGEATDSQNRSFGWYQDDVERFIPQYFTLDYNKAYSINEGGRVSFVGSVNTGVNYDLQRYTYSKFYFTLSAGLRINRFLDVILSSHSENAVIFRYFQNIPVFGNQEIDVPGEKNIFIDVFNSFRFDDIKKRQESGFKLKSFGLDLIHHLGDWDATLGVTLTPELDKTSYPYQYKFLSKVSFIVQWKPIKEFRTTTKYDSNEGFGFE